MNSIRLFFVSVFVSLLPETRFFSLKRRLYTFCGLQIGKGVRIASSARFTGHGACSVGDGTWVGLRAMIISSCKVEIGANVDIGPCVYIGTGTHEIDRVGVRSAGACMSLPVTIGDGVWIGANATILPGVKIGRKAVIAAGSVVVGEVSARTVVAGVPAVVKRNL